MNQGPALGMERRIALGAAVAFAAVALAVYRPWIDRPFSILDFSEFLPLLIRPDGFIARIRALTQYYVVDHGRLNLVSYVALAAKWGVLGAKPVVWQWARVVEMGAVMGGAYLLLRRLAVRPVGAVVGVSLFLATRVASEAWTRMTMGEPLGLLFSLGALLLATRWRETDRPGPAIAWSGMLMALAVLSKEMFIGLLPLVWLIGLGRQPDGTLAAPTWDARSLKWLLWSGALPLIAFAVTAVVALSAGASGISALYGTSSGRGRLFADLLMRSWFVQGARPGLAALLMPGELCFVALLVGGLWVGVQRGAGRKFTWPAVGAALLSLALAVLYLPWPYFNQYYALPFLLGPALLLGLAVDALVAKGKFGAIAAAVGSVGMLIGVAPGTARLTSFGIALQQVNGELASLLGKAPNADHIVVARRELLAQAWTGTGPTLRRYALATGAAPTLPPADDFTCPDAAQLLQRGLGRTILISYHQNCGPIGGSSATIMRRFNYLQVDWDGAGIRADSVGADIVAGPLALAPAPRGTP